MNYSINSSGYVTITWVNTEPNAASVYVVRANDSSFTVNVVQDYVGISTGSGTPPNSYIDTLAPSSGYPYYYEIETVNASGTAYSPYIEVPNTVGISGSGISSTVSLSVPTLSWMYNITGSGISSTVVVGTPVVGNIQSYSILFPQIASTVVLYGPVLNETTVAAFPLNYLHLPYWTNVSGQSIQVNDIYVKVNEILPQSLPTNNYLVNRYIGEGLIKQKNYTPVIPLNYFYIQNSYGYWLIQGTFSGIFNISSVSAPSVANLNNNLTIPYNACLSLSVSSSQYANISRTGVATLKSTIRNFQNNFVPILPSSFYIPNGSGLIFLDVNGVGHPLTINSNGSFTIT